MDFDSDGDVDGRDLYEYIGVFQYESLENFADEFGRNP